MLMTLVTYAVFGGATLGFAQSLNTFDEEAPDIRLEVSPEEPLEGGQTEATGGWVIEKNGEDAYPEMRDKRRASDDSHRYVNPHPELGCLYYDENDRAHWFPGCREL